MFKKNRDLTEVFNDRWKANHNKELENKVKNNKINTINRSYGINNNPINSNLNKPIGYVTTSKDQFNRDTVLDLIKVKQRIVPVGRLDMYTSGALLLTNDGDFANILMHPSNEVEKTYLAIIEGVMTTEEIYKLKDGVVIDGIKVVPKRVKIKKKDLEKNKSKVEVTIVEGRNHIVKKMFEEVGHPVNKLTRERLAFLDVKGLQSGEYRYLSNDEVQQLMKLKKSSKK